MTALRIGVGVLLVLALWVAIIDHRNSSGEPNKFVMLDWFTKDGTQPLLSEAQNELVKQPPDTTAATKLIRRAIVMSPLNIEAYYLLAATNELAGDADAAEKIYAYAIARSKRSYNITMHLIQRFAKAGNYVETAKALDILLSGFPRAKNWWPTIDALVNLTTNAKVRIYLMERLQERPVWSTDYLATLATKGDTSLFPFVTQDLPKDPELLHAWSDYLRRLVRSDDARRAYSYWTNIVKQSGTEDIQDLFNGNFGAPLRPIPFDWMIDPIKSVDSRIADTSVPGAASALTIHFIGAFTKFRAVRQTTVLDPGSYLFKGRAYSKSFKTPRGMIWRIYCQGGGASTQLAETPLIGAGNEDGWQDYSVEFAIPENGCDHQMVQLEIAGRIDAEFTASGAISLTGLAITPADKPDDG